MYVAAVAVTITTGLIALNLNGRWATSLTFVHKNAKPATAQRYHHLISKLQQKSYSAQIRYQTLYGSSLMTRSTALTRWQVSDSSTTSSSMDHTTISTGSSCSDMDHHVPKPLRMLALHGSGGTGESLWKTLQKWNANMHRERNTPFRPSNPGETVPEAVNENQVLLLDITTVTGHVPMEDGFSWWKLRPGERSFNADHYDGFEQSRTLVLDALSSSSSSEVKKEAYDIIFGHSQGAILLTALLALNAIPEHPKIGYIFNGVAWPNPYSLELESVKFMGQSNCHATIRVLILLGERDRINPPEQAHRVAAALRTAGCDVTVVIHPNGHSIPMDYDDGENDDNIPNPNDNAATMTTWGSIRQWMFLE